jgi:hypothetical protein
MEICGHIEQREFANFTFVDNKKRDNVNFEVRYLKADKTDFLEVIPLDNYRYTFLIPSEQTYQRGICILEILADNVQISQSPLRVQISSRNCAAQLNDNLRVADIEGDCVCKSGSIPLFGCSAYSVFLPSIIVPIIIVAIICGFVYIEYKRKKHDGIWRVKPSDLKFDDPPVVIGRGTFGLVLLSSYRGTTVAVKRVIPPKCKSEFDEAFTFFSFKDNIFILFHFFYKTQHYQAIKIYVTVFWAQVISLKSTTEALCFAMVVKRNHHLSWMKLTQKRQKEMWNLMRYNCLNIFPITHLRQ